MFCFSYNLKNSSIFIFVKLLKKSGYLSLKILECRKLEKIYLFFTILQRKTILKLVISVIIKRKYYA